MTKQEIRILFTEKRNQLSPVEYASLNEKLLLNFQQTDFGGIRCIHLFLPIYKRKEADTLLVRDWLKKHHPGIKLAYPKTNFANYTMQSYAADQELVLETNSLGITEPVSGTLIDASEIDLILIPLLAFDLAGYRVGYGKGFYDRFVAQCRPGTQFTGLALFEAVEQIDDINKFDLKMHRCITPNSIYEFK